MSPYGDVLVPVAGCVCVYIMDAFAVGRIMFIESDLNCDNFL